MAKGRPSIRDVARESGVSATTVSLVINGQDHRISAGTRRRVLATIDRLNYRPSRLAQGLPSRSSRTLAVILPALDKAFADPYFGEIISGIYDHAAEHDFRILLEVARRSFVRTRRYQTILEDCSVDGLLFLGATEEHRWLEEFSDTERPLLLVNNHFAQWGLDTILCDYPNAGRLAADHLVGLGHRRIAHVSGPASEVLTAHEVTEAFVDRLVEQGLDLPDRLVVNGRFTVEGGQAAADQILTGHPEVTAIFCGNDKMAFGAYQAARIRGRRVGRDVSIIGCDDLPAAALADPPMTTIRLNYYRLGVEACDRMLVRLGVSTGLAPSVTTEASVPVVDDSAARPDAMPHRNGDRMSGDPASAGSTPSSRSGPAATAGAAAAAAVATTARTGRIPVTLTIRASAGPAPG